MSLDYRIREDIHKILGQMWKDYPRECNFWACRECSDGAGDGWLCLEHQEERTQGMLKRIRSLEEEIDRMRKNR